MIKLTENLCIIADERQYIVGKIPSRDCSAEGRKVDKKARKIENPRYYLTLSAAVNQAVSMLMFDKVSKNEIITLHEYISELNRLQDDFKKLINQTVKRSVSLLT